MKVITLFVEDATSDPKIQEIEGILNESRGIDRVLIDTDDGEIKIEYNEEQISPKHIILMLQERDYNIK
ncbi:hypothetical protein ACFSTA_19420 [Ornithinibacillus salinisoli]|uniref:HMA domain-containing protein n=1 Tax=Ornithinibacillus salinisoli TaxID=1848459 RepID=A0ABW4W6S0_9BACI